MLLTITEDQIYCEGWQGIWNNHGGGNNWTGDANGVGWAKLGVGSHFVLGTTILKGSHINSAIYRYTASWRADTITFKIKAELAASPAVMANYVDYSTRRGLTALGGVSDAGLVTTNILDIVNELETAWATKDYDITALVQELVNTFNVDNVEIFKDDHDGRTALGINLHLTAGSYLIINYSPPITPVATTQAATAVASTAATLNGTVAAINDTDIVERGFVFGVASHGDPGDVDPGFSGYTFMTAAVGTYGLGAYSLNIGSLSTGTLYYARAFAKNDIGHYAYGAEISFNTLATTTFAINGWCNAAMLHLSGDHLHFQGLFSSPGLGLNTGYSGLFAIGGVLQNFRVQLDAPPVLAPLVWKLQRVYIDGTGAIQEVDAGVTLSFGLADTYKEDLTTVVPVSNKDAFQWLITSATMGGGGVSWSSDFTPLTNGYFPQSQAWFNGLGGFGLGKFGSIFGGYDVSADPVKTVMSHDGNMQHFVVSYLRESSLWTGDVTLRLMKNGAPTGVSFNAACGANPHISHEVFILADHATVVPFVAGDVFWLDATVGTDSGHGFMPFWRNFGFVFTGMNYEVYDVTSGLPEDNIHSCLSNIENNQPGTTWSKDLLFPPPHTGVTMKTFKPLYTDTAVFYLKTPPGAGKYWEAELWVNGSSTGLKLRCSNAETLKIVKSTKVLLVNSSSICWVLTPGSAPALDYVSMALLLGPPGLITPGLPKSQICRVPRVQSVYT